MEYEIFRDLLLEHLQERIGTKADLSVIQVHRNNIGESESLVIRPNDMEDTLYHDCDRENYACDRECHACDRERHASAYPAVRLALCYEAFQNGTSMEELEQELLQVLEERTPECLQALTLDTYEDVKSSVFLRLVNTEQNHRILVDRPHREFKDLSVIYYLHLDEEQAGAYSTPVTSALLKLWQISEDTLFRQAWENFNRVGSWQLIPIETLLLSMFEQTPEREVFGQPELPGTLSGQPDLSGRQEESGELNTGLYVLSDQKGLYGAVHLLNDAALREAARLLQGDFWVFPSSIYELILASADIGRDRAELEKMVQEINRTQLLPEEVLSDHVYYYNARTGMLL